MALTREEFLNRKKRRTQTVTLADGAEILVREPSALEFENFDHDGPHRAARLVCAFAVDAAGNRLFTDADLNKMMAACGSGDVEGPALAILDLAGVTRLAMERAAKNSKPTRNGDSSTASPATSGEPAKS